MHASFIRLSRLSRLSPHQELFSVSAATHLQGTWEAWILNMESLPHSQNEPIPLGTLERCKCSLSEGWLQGHRCWSLLGVLGMELDWLLWVVSAPLLDGVRNDHLDLIAQLRGQVIMVCDGACKNADLTLTLWHRLWIVWLGFGVYAIHVLNIVIQQSRNKVFVIGNNLILTRTIDQKSQDRAGWHWFDLIWHLEPLPSTKSNMRHQTYLNVTLWRVRSIQSIDRLTLT